MYDYQQTNRIEYIAVAGKALSLRAKFAGGADMFASGSSNTIGKQNAEAVAAALIALKIPIVARDCGGRQGRRMSFHPASGTVSIEIVGNDPVEL